HGGCALPAPASAGPKERQPHTAPPAADELKIPDYHDSFNEERDANHHSRFRHELYDEQRNTVEQFLQGVTPVVSHTHDGHTVHVMPGGNYIITKDGEKRPVASGKWMGYHDKDLKEIVGIDQKKYDSLPTSEKMKADAPVQAVKY